MSNASYVLGTREYLMLEIEATTPGFTFVPADWTAKVTLVELGTDFDSGTAIWTDAVLEAIDGKVYAKVLLGYDPAPPAGKYRALVSLTKKVGGVEIPLLKGVGLVVVAEG